MGSMMRNGPKILIVEDEPQIGEIMQAYFEREHFRVALVRDGQEALMQYRRWDPELVILDVKLPQLDGFQVLSAIRNIADTPIIMVTALGEDYERLAGLKVGADDYVVKPFNPVELVARAHAVLRRSRRQLRARVLRIANIEVNLDTLAVTVCGAETSVSIDVTGAQFRLLARLLEASPRVLDRSELMTACLPESEAFERTVDSHLSKLRRRLQEAGASVVLESVRGVGYRLRHP